MAPLYNVLACVFERKQIVSGVGLWQNIIALAHGTTPYLPGLAHERYHHATKYACPPGAEDVGGHAPVALIAPARMAARTLN